MPTEAEQTAKPSRTSRRGRPALWVLPIAVAVGILVLSLGPDLVKDRLPEALEALPHVVAYALLAAAALAVRGVAGRKRSARPWASAAAVALAMIGLGALIEAGQAMVHRDAQWSDVAADALGVGLGLGFWLVAQAVRGAHPAAPSAGGQDVPEHDRDRT